MCIDHYYYITIEILEIVYKEDKKRENPHKRTAEKNDQRSKL